MVAIFAITVMAVATDFHRDFPSPIILILNILYYLFFIIYSLFSVISHLPRLNSSTIISPIEFAEILPIGFLTLKI